MPISEPLGRGVVSGNVADSLGENRDGPTSRVDAVDEMLEINGSQLRLRADRTDSHTVASKDSADAGKPIRFTTVELVGYLTFTELNVVAVVGVCSRSGCLLQLGPDGSSLRCPAGGTQYRPDGRVLHPRRHHRPPPLTRLHTRLADGNLQALVPHAAPSCQRQMVAASELVDCG